MTKRYSLLTETIKKYLFNELSSGEREKIEERLFEDEVFFYEVMTVENDLMDLYALRKLTGDELVRFEKSLLASPGRREKVASALALQRCIAEAKQPELRLEKGLAIGAGGLPLWKRFTTFAGLRAAAPQFAVAALLILLSAGMVFLLIERRRVNQELAYLRENQRSEESQRQERLLQDRLQAAQEREEELKRQLETERGEATTVREQLQLATSEREKAGRELEELRRKQGGLTPLQPTAIAQVYLQPDTPGRRGSIAEKVLGGDIRGLVISLELEAGSELKTPISVEINGKKVPIDVQLHSLSSGIIVASINISPRRVADGTNTIILKNADNNEISSYRLIIKRQ